MQIFPYGQVPVPEPALVIGAPETMDFSDIDELADRHSIPGVQPKASANMRNVPVAFSG
ncbi:hypothetical protein [Corynebacterium argentoratense]|uniref:hypothetical protein n=1 Tax=Corynebacterium argentoratense TaxID=42817 RepID=UPI00248DFC6D|nr:hypothetical protein [Corynebacterium argentoratense]